MDLSILPQTLLNGVILAGIYVLVAMGITLVFAIMQIPNFVHGEFLMIGAVATYFLVTFGLSYPFAILVAMVFVALLGVMVERIFFKPFRGDHLPVIIICLGLIAIIQSSAFMVFGTEVRMVPVYFQGVVSLGNVATSVERLVIVIAAVILITVLYYFVRYMKIGRAMRAVQQNPEGAALQGININAVSSTAMAIGSGLAGAAGALLAPVFFVTPTMGSDYLLKGFIVVIIGGMGSISGVILGGIALGLIDAIAVAYLGSSLGNIIGFVLLIVIIMVKPKGILGRD
ncbi:MAG: branched-chain amino acid ABC transporter permease [Chloroflexi bacterium]|nr:branched-chain amino acid ABC transporter permease [Chloroflexota bacterium]